MRNSSMSVFSIVLLFTIFAVPVSTSDEVSITTPRTTIVTAGGLVHVPLMIRIRNHRDNRWLKLDWGWGSTGQQLNNPTAKEMESGEYERFLQENEYIIFTDEYLKPNVSRSMPNGLYLPTGDYEIRATVTRKVDGKDRDFTAMVAVTVGAKDNKEGR